MGFFFFSYLFCSPINFREMWVRQKQKRSRHNNVDDDDGATKQKWEWAENLFYELSKLTQMVKCGEQLAGEDKSRVQLISRASATLVMTQIHMVLTNERKINTTMELVLNVFRVAAIVNVPKINHYLFGMFRDSVFDIPSIACEPPCQALNPMIRRRCSSCDSVSSTIHMQTPLSSI
jgi:hypothetical protein